MNGATTTLTRTAPLRRSGRRASRMWRKMELLLGSPGDKQRKLDGLRTF